MKKNKYYSFSTIEDNKAKLFIYGDIVSYEWYDNDVSASGFKEDLEALGDISELDVHINSYGGSTFEGLAIYNLLKQHKAKINVYIDGIAASAASIIAMAGDKIYVPSTALIMIHNCWTYTGGNAKELRKTADDMDKIAEAYKAAYLSKINITEEKLEELLEAETYLTSKECVEMGFADEIIEVEENESVNQHANRFIMNLVNKIKQQEAEKNNTKVVIDEELPEKIAQKVVQQIKTDLNNLQEEKNKQLNNKNQDTLVVSFFNEIFKK